MAETEKKQDQEIDQNMTGGTAEQTGAKQADAGGAGNDKSSEDVNGSCGTAQEEASEAGAQTENASSEEDSRNAADDEADSTSRDGDDDAAADESNGAAAGEPASATKEKKSFFSKKDKNREKDKDKERIAELEDRVMRQMAEFENFRRRSEKEKQQMFETGARSVIEKILPVVDNFERGLSSIPEAERQGAVAEGMNMIYKQLQTELDNIGVKAIDAVGQEFDPAKHNAVMQVSSEEYESGIVAQELQKGYTYRDTVIRHSMVAVVE